MSKYIQDAFSFAHYLPTVHPISITCSISKATLGMYIDTFHTNRNHLNQDMQERKARSSPAVVSKQAKTLDSQDRTH